MFGHRAGDLVAGRYTIVAAIGRGATSDVYEASDRGSAVAVKILRASVARDPDAVVRFQREAEVHARVRHPNVARLHDVGVLSDGTPFLVMELIRGRSLAHVLRERGRVEPATAAYYAWQALRGLAATHAVDVLHRDLKPGNLVLEPSPTHSDRLVVIDFGFAALEGSAGITRQGFVVGSLSYLAPERLRANTRVDARADLYALGCVLFELVTGRPPFIGDESAIVHGHLDVPAPAPSSVAPGASIPPALDAIIVRALAKSPDDRAPSALAMAGELQASFRSPTLTS